MIEEEFPVAESEEIITEAVPIFDQDEFFRRLTDWASEVMPEQAAPVEPDTIARAVVSAMDAREEQARLMEGEILVPGSEDITVIKEVVQGIFSFFQQDDHDVLSGIQEDVTGIREYLESQEAANADLHSMMTTSFADYTVTEGLLLLVLLWLIIQSCTRMLKGGLSWLLW